MLNQRMNLMFLKDQNVNNFNSNFVNNGSNFVTGNPNVNQNSNMQNGNISGNWQL